MSVYGFGRELASNLVKVGRREGLRSRGSSSLGYPDFLSWLIELHVGKTDSAINKSAAGTVSRWQPTTAVGSDQVDAVGDLEDSTENDTVMNLFANVGSGKWVIYIRVWYSFFMIAAEC